MLDYDLFSELKANPQNPRNGNCYHNCDTGYLDLVNFPDKCRYDLEYDDKHDEACSHSE